MELYRLPIADGAEAMSSITWVDVFSKKGVLLKRIWDPGIFDLHHVASLFFFFSYLVFLFTMSVCCPLFPATFQSPLPGYKEDCAL